MPLFKDSYFMAAPVKIVWDVSIDLDAWRDASEAKVEMLSDGPFAVGSRFSETRRSMGRESTTEWEVTEMDQPNSYKCVGEGMGASWTYRQYLVPDADGTKFFVEMDIKPNGLASKLTWTSAWPVMGPMMRRGVAKEFAGMAKICEKRAKS